MSIYDKFSKMLGRESEAENIEKIERHKDA